MSRTRLSEWCLRIGLAFAFLYPPIHALSNPESWIGYFPPFTRGIVPDEALLHSFGAIEVILAIWILSGWRIEWPSVIAALMLVGIVVFNLGNFEVLFRDLSIAALAIALAIIAWNRRERRNTENVAMYTP